MKIYSEDNEDSGNVVYPCNEIGILNIDLNDVNVDNNFDEDDPETLILIRPLKIWKIQTLKCKCKEIFSQNI